MYSLSAIEFPIEIFDMTSAAELTPKVATLEERVANHIKFFWVVVTFGFGWLAALSGLIFHINDTASRIEKAQASIQVKQNLSEITALANSVQVEGKTPNQTTKRELGAASKAVTSAMGGYPQYPEVWKAASSLVNLRSLTSGEADIPSDVAAKAGPSVPNRGDCFAIPMPRSSLGKMPPELNNYIWVVSVPWHDCTLYLDNLEDFGRSTLAGYISAAVGPNRETVFIDLTLVRVNVIYRGGPIIPVRKLIFYDCRFGFDVPNAPSGRGKDLLEAILSKDFEDRSLEISIPTA